MRKLAVAWSAVNSPRPVDGTPLLRVRDQLLRIPAWLLSTSSLITNVQVPNAFLPLNELRGSSGWNEPKNDGGPDVIEVGGLSSKLVLLKLAWLPPAPAFLNNCTFVVWSGARRYASRSGSLGCVILSVTV